jgi:hypothetical protein
MIYYFDKISESNKVLAVHKIDAATSEKGKAKLQEIHGWTNWVETKKDGSIRGNFAGPTMDYDSSNDLFLYEKPFDSWTLNTSTGDWEPPVTYPSVTTWTNESNEDRPMDIGWNEENSAWHAKKLVGDGETPITDETYTWNTGTSSWDLIP